MTIDDVLGGQIKIGSTTYTMTEAKYNGVVVWPLNVTYVIHSWQANWSSGNQLNAAGTNYAYFTGTIYEYRNGSYVRSFTATLTPSCPSLDVEGTRVYGYNLGTTETSQTTFSVSLTYGNSDPKTANITQEANVKTAYGSPEYGPKYDQVTTDTGNPYGHYVSLSGQYSSSSSPCPAWGGTSSLTRIAYHLQGTKTTYKQDVTQYYTYTALAEPVGETTTQTGTDYGERSVNDTPAISRISGSTAFTISGTNVTIADRETTVGGPRNATFRATNGTATASIIIYQEANEYIELEPSVVTYEGSPYDVDENYSVSLKLDSFKTPNTGAPASGATGNRRALLTVTASHDHSVKRSDVVVTTEQHTYTARPNSSYPGASSSEIVTTTVSGPTTSVDYPEPYYVGDHTGFKAFVLSRRTTSDARYWIEVESEGTEYLPNGRSAVIGATNGGVDAPTVTIYQKKNEVTTTVWDAYHISVAMVQSIDLIPTSGGQYDITYRSEGDGTNYYTSGASATFYDAAVTSAVSRTNCTGGPSSVSGTGTFAILVGTNSGSSRDVTVTLTLDSTHFATMTKPQRGVATGLSVRLTPRVVRATGRIWLKCEVLDYGTPDPMYPFTLTNLKLDYTPTGGSKATMSGTSSIVFPVHSGGGYTSEVQLPTAYQFARGEEVQTGVIVPQDSTQNPSMTLTTGNNPPQTAVSISAVSANYTVDAAPTPI